MNNTTLKSLGTFLISTAVFFFFSNVLSAQDTFTSPAFESNVIRSSPGKYLAFTLSNLPDPKAYHGTDAPLDLQIHWQIGANCDAGESFSETVKISSTTHYIETNYRLTKDDDRKKIRILVSYVEPTGKEQMPAKGFIAAMNDCITLYIPNN